jgi:hypothetical protein
MNMKDMTKMNEIFRRVITSKETKIINKGKSTTG